MTTPSPDENKRIARRAFDEVVEAGNLDALEELYAPDFVKHGGLAGSTESRDAFADYVRSLHAAFPDLDVTEEFSTCEGEFVTTVNAYHGTHEGPFMGVAPTDREVEVAAIVVNRIQDGTITEAWVQADTFGLLQQLGAVELGTGPDS